MLISLLLLGCRANPATPAAESATATVSPIPERRSPTETVLPAQTTTSAPPSATPLAPPPAAPAATPGPPDLTVGDCPDGDKPRPCPDDYDGWLNRFSAPPGFEIEFVAQLPAGQAPTSITFGPEGDDRLYVAAIPDPFQDESRMGVIWLLEGDTFTEFASGFLLPAGLAFEPESGDLFVSHRASDSEGQLSRIPADGSAYTPVVSGLPCCYTAREHQPNGIAFGPDGFLYMGIGALTDHGPSADDPNLPDDLHPLEAGILRISPDGSLVEKFADGLRNPYDVAFDSTGQLWTGDNGPDFGLPERLHRIAAGGHYGFPYYEGCALCLPLPEGLTVSPPFAEFRPHAVPAGLTANTGAQYPQNYFDNVFVALWNPWVSPGLWRVRPNGAVEPFVLGLFSPIDVTQAPDGALLVADFFFGHIFRITWKG